MTEPSPFYIPSIKETVSVDEIIVVLNSLIHIDPNAMHRFVTTLFPCNEEFPYYSKMKVDNFSGFGFLGIINRLFLENSDVQYLIEAIFDDCGGLGSPRLVRFQRKVYPPLMSDKEFSEMMSSMEMQEMGSGQKIP